MNEADSFQSRSEKEIFFEALDKNTPQERAAFLDGACGKNRALRAKVEALLADHFQEDAFMKQPAAAREEPVKTIKLDAAINPNDEAVGQTIGRYRLLEKLGEGGCGAVYVAQQNEPVRRRVALKVIKLGMDTKEVIARFEAERQALAMMDHPNIAKVFDAGATENGRPYFVMELVRGIKITEYCDQNQLNTKQRLDLVIEVCHAVQHAHQKGIIHRDIKPSNIMVTLHDGVPVTKVIDFGIAKATEGRLTNETVYTQLHQFIGTPAYMSPEQAEMSGLDIDTRSDIYSLGVLLYELLAGSTPFDAKELMSGGLDAMRKIIREQEPVRPSTRFLTLHGKDLTTTAKRRSTDSSKLLHELRGDLDWIVMKCLEKDRMRRYETANGLAMDIQRHMSDEPVAARPPSNCYRLQKMIRRNKLAFMAGIFVIAVLITGVGFATAAVIRIKRANQQMRQAKDDATEKLRASYLSEARALRTSGQGGRRFASLDAVRKAAAIRASTEARNEAIASLAVSDLRVSKEVILKGHAANDLVGFDFNLEKYAVGDADGNVTIHAVTSDTVLAILPAPGLRVRRIRGFSPDSRFLRVDYKAEGGKSSVWVWDLKNQIAMLKESPSDAPADAPGEPASDLAGNFSSDSRFFARCHPDGTLSLYDLGSGQELKRLPGIRLFDNLIFNPGNNRLACESEADSEVEILEVESGRKVVSVACPSGVSILAWSPDGMRLATGCLDFRIYLWNAETGQREAVLEGPTAKINSVAFDHSGNLLADSSWDGLIRLWNTGNGCLIAKHPGSSWRLQFSEDDRQLLGWQYVAHYGSLEVADSREFRLLCVQSPERSGFSSPNFSADGRILAANAGDTVRFWNAFSGKQLAAFPLRCETHVFEPDGRGLIVADRMKGVRRLALERMGDSNSLAYRLHNPQPLYDAPGVRQGALSRDGRYFAFKRESEEEELILDLKNLSAKPVVLRPDPLADRIAMSPDGRWVTTSSWNTTTVKIWDARSGELVRTLPMPGRTLAAFSSDGRWLATSTSEYQLWEVGSWHPKGSPRPGCDVPEWNFTAFSPDGKMMARTVDGKKVQLLETSTETPLATLEAPDSIALGPFQFSPDGSHLAVMQQDLQVQVWDLRLIRQDLKEMRLDWDMPPFPSVEPSVDACNITLGMEWDPSSQAESLSNSSTNNPTAK
jgi:serine/threonine protein kinase/WD40 repeat protein